MKTCNTYVIILVSNFRWMSQHKPSFISKSKKKNYLVDVKNNPCLLCKVGFSILYSIFNDVHGPPWAFRLYHLASGSLRTWFQSLAHSAHLSIVERWKSQTKMKCERLGWNLTGWVSCCNQATCLAYFLLFPAVCV